MPASVPSATMSITPSTPSTPTIPTTPTASPTKLHLDCSVSDSEENDDSEGEVDPECVGQGQRVSEFLGYSWPFNKLHAVNLVVLV